MKEKTTNKVSMPYNADIQVTEAIIDALAREREIEVGELFKKVVAKNMPTKSYSLTLCKFLGFAEAQGTRVKLTTLGYKYVNTSQKKELVAKNLPDKYKTILAWIKNHNGTMTLDEIKTAIIDNWGTPPKERVFNSMLRTFGNFCNNIGVIKYVKGNAGRIEITQLGLSALSHNKSDEETVSQNTPADTPTNIIQDSVELDGKYPIRILTKEGKPFDWDIHSEEDWKVVEAAVEAIKRRWKNNNHAGLGAKGSKPNLSSEAPRDNSEVAN